MIDDDGPSTRSQQQTLLDLTSWFPPYRFPKASRGANWAMATSSDQPMRWTAHGRRSRLFVVVPILVMFGGYANLPYLHVPIRSSGLRLAEGGQTGITHIVQAATSTARQGAYYLPNGYESRPLPLMVSFHGTGGKGSLMIL